MRALSSLFRSYALALAVDSAHAWFVRPPTDLISKAGAAGVGVRYKKVPTGICETRENVTSLSGFVDVDQDHHMYFHFFEARNRDPKTAPLTIFLNGGPGSSSMFGLYSEEIASCRINSSGQVEDNPYSWSSASNMMFIDQPVTAGFSYIQPLPGYFNQDTDPDKGLVYLPSESCPDYAEKYICGTYSSTPLKLLPRTTAEAAPHFYMMLQGFIGAFPEYSSNRITITGESSDQDLSISYAGRYIPTFANYILDQNKNLPSGHKHVNLTSVAIGNGCYDSDVLFRSHVDQILNNAYGVSYPSESVRNEVLNLLKGPGNCLEQLHACSETGDAAICNYAREWCFEHVENRFIDATNRSYFDIRRFGVDAGPYTQHNEYLNTEHVQQSLGVFTNYSDSSNIINQWFKLGGDLGRDSHSAENIRNLVDAGMQVALYAGDSDYVCNWNGNLEIAEKVGVFGGAGFANFTSADGKVRGHVKQSGSFSFLRFFYAGHEVPWYQPNASLDFFQRFIDGKDIATGTKEVKSGSDYKTRGLTKSDIFLGNATTSFKPLAENATFQFIDYSN